MKFTESQFSVKPTLLSLSYRYQISDLRLVEISLIKRIDCCVNWEEASGNNVNELNFNIKVINKKNGERNYPLLYEFGFYLPPKASIAEKKEIAEKKYLLFLERLESLKVMFPSLISIINKLNSIN